MSISEAYFAFFKKKEEQKRIKDELNKFIIQALRSSHSRTDVEQYKDIPIVIEKKLDKELTMLDSNIDRVLKTAVQIPHNGEVHRNGIIFRSKLVLKNEPDAFVVSAIDWYIRKNIPKGEDINFISLDNKSLASKIEVKNLLKRRNIKTYLNSSKCMAYLRSLGLI